MNKDNGSSLTDSDTEHLKPKPLVERNLFHRPADSDPEMLVGKLLDGRYEVIEKLGAGGFSRTYLARDTRRPHSPICVVKHIKPCASNLESIEMIEQRFMSEANTLERLGRHNQIPQLLAYFKEEQEFYLVQEYVAGDPLYYELQPDQSWSQDKVIHFLLDTLPILEFVHSQGVIHRDIKPSNLIRRQSDGRLVLIDFGAVKELSSPSLLMDLTAAIGTPGYMASEQGQGRPRPSSDLYGLGMIAVKALTAIEPSFLPADPFTGELVWQDRTQAHPELKQFLHRLTRYHFKDRFQSATEALQVLQDLIESHRLTSIVDLPTRYLPSYPSQALFTRFRGSILLAGILLAGILLAGILSGVRRFAKPEGDVSQPLPTVAANELLPIEPIQILTGHEDLIWSVALFPNLDQVTSSQFMSAGEDGYINLWDIDQNRLLKNIAFLPSAIKALAISPDTKKIIASNYKTLSIFDRETGKLLNSLEKHTDTIWSLAITKEGGTLVSGSADRTVHIWDLKTGKLQRTLSGHADWVYAVALSQTDKDPILATGSRDNTIKLWQLSTGQMIKTLTGHTSTVRCLAIHGQILVSGSWDQTLRVWDLTTGSLLKTLRGHQGQVVTVAISPDGRFLASGGVDNIIYLWDLTTGERIQTLLGHTDWVLSVAFEADGKRLISSSKDKTIRIWPLPDKITPSQNNSG